MIFVTAFYFNFFALISFSSFLVMTILAFFLWRKLFDLEPIARSELFEKIQQGVLVFDLNNRLVDFNQTACLEMKITKNDLGKTTRELLDHWPEMLLFVENNQKGSLDLHHYDNEKTFFYNIQILELENPRKVKQGKLVVIKDVSDLINTERERSYTASKLDAVIQAMPDLMFVIDNRGFFTDFFAPETDHLFLAKEEVLGASLYHLFNKEEADILMKMLSDCLISNELNTHHYEMNFPGVLKHYEVRISKMDDTHVLAIVRDVSESHEMKQDLLYQSGFQKILMNLASRFIYIAEEETNIVIHESLRQIGEYTGVDRCYVFRYDFENGTMSITHEWCKQGVWSRIEASQQIAIDLIPNWLDLHLKGELTKIENLSQFDPKNPIRIRLESLDIQSIITIPMISQKNCLGFVGFDNIHTKRIWHDPEISLLKIFTGMLANLQEKITIEQSLVEARSRAEASNKLKTAFMNNISHEIRTPLNGIIGFGEIIANEQLSLEEKNKFLTVVQESSARLIQTIDDYVDISMLVTGNQEIRPNRFNLSQLIEEVVDEFSGPCKLKNLTITAEIPENLKQLTINSDSGLIHKIFNHLVGNSLKFTEKGNIRIRLALEGDRLIFEVKDSGIGITEDAQKYIFDSFMQEDFSSTRRYEGSGLGLSIVKGIVTLLGGEITLNSTKGEGSTFIITFPFGKMKK
ncbi:MAG: ATP-binding protein [Bacteroidetes bacterium]|nr:ATP-binding protein [Bacteroidota bacterium]